MENKKSYRSVYMQKLNEVHPPEEVKLAFESSFGVCLEFVQPRPVTARSALFSKVWQINPDALIVQVDLFVARSEPVAVRNQYLVIGKNGTKESNALLVQCIEESGVITSAWYMHSRKRGNVKTCYHHISGNDKPVAVHKANLLIDGDNLVLSIRTLSHADRARMKSEKKLIQSARGYDSHTRQR